jgi:hypothetical protein
MTLMQKPVTLEALKHMPYVCVESSKRRVIDRLRDACGGEWTYRDGRWQTDGWSVFRCAVMCGPAEDDFAEQWHTSTGALVLGLGDRLELKRGQR